MYFFFNDTATTEIYTSLHTLSLHDALPIYNSNKVKASAAAPANPASTLPSRPSRRTLQALARSEEHTSELQSLMRNSYAVFCLKKKTHTQVYSEKIEQTEDLTTPSPCHT